MALGDEGVLTRGSKVLDALHSEGWRVQAPPQDAVALVARLRIEGRAGDADDVEALALEVDHFRRGWGPTTPTERRRRIDDIFAIRSMIDRAVEGFLSDIDEPDKEGDDLRRAVDSALADLDICLAFINNRLQEINGPQDRPRWWVRWTVGIVK